MVSEGTYAGNEYTHIMYLFTLSIWGPIWFLVQRLCLDQVMGEDGDIGITLIPSYYTFEHCCFIVAYYFIKITL